MSDMYGALRSNEFKVKDVEAFKKWFEKYRFGEEVEVWGDITGMGGSEDYSGTISFGGEEQYPNAYPMMAIDEDDGFEEDTTEADLQVFADELRQHLQPGEVFQVVAGGNEKLRYVGFSELIIAEDVEAPSFQAYYSDDNADSLRARMKGDSTE